MIVGEVEEQRTYNHHYAVNVEFHAPIGLLQGCGVMGFRVGVMVGARR